MNELISRIAGWPVLYLPAAMLAVFSCFGTGRFLMEKLNRKGPYPFLPVFTLGFDFLALIAFLFALVFPGGWSWCLLLPGLCFGFQYRKELHVPSKWIFLPGMLLLFFSGNLLCPPFGWDECVYQLAVPLRWYRDGAVYVYPDLPYSGFPLMPQFFYLCLMPFGAGAAKAFAYLVLGIVLLSPFSWRRLNGIRGAAVSCALICAPVMLHFLESTYAEPYLALNLIAGLLVPFNSRICGFFAGSAASVKLSGWFIIPSLFVLRKNRDSWKNAGWFAGIAFGTALLFYLRPWIVTGNPFWPYFGTFFSSEPAVEAMSQYHHALGNLPFGSSAWYTFFLAPVLLAFSGYYRIFDGCWGIQSLILLLFAVWYGWKKYRSKGFRNIFPLSGMIVLLYVSWYFSAPQARFLFPEMCLIGLVAGYGLALPSERPGQILCGLLIVISLIGMFRTNYPVNTLQRWVHCADRVDQLYSETGDSYVPAADVLRQTHGKVLLILEERTLYLPGKSVIGTPFFQSRYFPAGKKVTPETLVQTLAKGKFDAVYFRLPENNPDLIGSCLEQMQPLFRALLVLEAGGILERQDLPGKAILYKVHPKTQP